MSSNASSQTQTQSIKLNDSLNNARIEGDDT
jgi:hypothetical protein